MVCKMAAFFTVLLAIVSCCNGVVFGTKLKFKGINKGEFKFKDCDQIRQAGYIESGIYTLWRDDNNSFKVHCQHEANNSFTLIQRRVDGSVDFAQPWHIYQNGFGSENSNYWAGLNTIYYLTYTGHTVLSITMQDWNNNIRTAHYSYFKLQDSDHYTLSIGGYRGDVPDDLSYNNGTRFATYDNPDTHQCVNYQHAGWWYNYCTYALPNGKYYYNGRYPPSGGWYDGIYWSDWMGYNYSLKYISMTLSKS